MARNYERERDWSVEKYGQLAARLDKALVEEFKQALASDGINYAAWLKDHVQAYLSSRAE